MADTACVDMARYKVKFSLALVLLRNGGWAKYSFSLPNA